MLSFYHINSSCAQGVIISGLFHVVKLPRLNALTCHELDTYDLAFKLRRKKFTIEVDVSFIC